jgi:hypothetical protein
MIQITAQMRVLVAVEPGDGRKGYSTLISRTHDAPRFFLTQHLLSVGLHGLL